MPLTSAFNGLKIGTTFSAPDYRHCFPYRDTVAEANHVTTTAIGKANARETFFYGISFL